jgi:hypothetical protein
MNLELHKGLTRELHQKWYKDFEQLFNRNTKFLELGYLTLLYSLKLYATLLFLFINLESARANDNCELLDLTPPIIDFNGPRWNPDLNPELGNNFNIINHNAFQVKRTALDYSYMLGADYERDIVALPENSHYLDAGAGNAYAILNYLVRHINPIKSHKITAIGYVKPPEIPDSLPDRDFRYLSGRFIEDISAKEIGPTDLISDVFGPFSYTASIDLILQKYLEVLNVNHSAYIYFRPQLITVNDQWDGLGQYFKAIQGAEIQWMNVAGPGYSAVIKVTKKRNDFKVPKLFLVHLESGYKNPSQNPLPHRFYSW